MHGDIQIIQVHQNGPHVPVKADATQECVLQDFPPENYCINVKDAEYLHLKKKHDHLQHSAVKQRDAGFWKQLSRVWNCLKVLPATFLSFSIFFQPDESKRKAKEETQEVHQKVVEAVDGLTAALKEGGRNVKVLGREIEVYYRKDNGDDQEDGAETQGGRGRGPGGRGRGLGRGPKVGGGVEGRDWGWCRGFVRAVVVEFDDGTFEVCEAYRLV